MEDKKKCRTCGVEKPLEDFGKNKNEKDGHAIYCFDCARKMSQDSKDRLARGERRRSRVPKDGGEILGQTTEERPLAAFPLEAIKNELAARGYKGMFEKVTVETVEF